MPKTVLDKVLFAIRALKDFKGSSRQAIAKYLKAEFAQDNANALKAALKKGVSTGVLVQQGQSFRIAGEEYEEPEGERLTVTDVKVGDGDEATVGTEVTVGYEGTLEATGEVFDKAGKFTFLLGAGEVIKGWDKGVLGMRVGGKRKLVVPPKLGYGAKGASPEIPPNATLLFTVKLKAVV
jgi:FKBP-type peptidyl-prolyl cis-trans isomerase